MPPGSKGWGLRKPTRRIERQLAVSWRIANSGRRCSHGATGAENPTPGNGPSIPSRVWGTVDRYAGLVQRCEGGGDRLPVHRADRSVYGFGYVFTATKRVKMRRNADGVLEPFLRLTPLIQPGAAPGWVQISVVALNLTAVLFVTIVANSTALTHGVGVRIISRLRGHG